MTKLFIPTQQQIDAAANLFMAKAYYEIVKSTSDKLEADIVAEGNYQYDSYYFNNTNARWITWAREEAPEDRIIKDVKDLHMIAGIREMAEHNYSLEADLDAARFYKELRNRALSLGFVHGENFEAKANNELHQAETALIEATNNIHGLDLDHITGSLENYNKLVELLSGLFAPFVQPTVNIKLRSYHDARIIPEWLFIGTYPTCYEYADSRKETAGHYKTIGRLFFRPLRLEFDPCAEKLYEPIMAIMQAQHDYIKEHIDTPLVISGSGQTMHCTLQE